MTSGPAPQVSVVVPALDAAATLPEQLERLARQSGAPPFEVVVADNGSRDGTPEVAAAWSDRLTLRVVDASQRRGAAHARNVGALAARAERLLFCDADDHVSLTWVATMAACTTPGTLVAGPVMRVSGTTPLDTPPGPGAPVENSSTTHRYMGFLPCVLSGSVGITRTDFLRVRGFDSSYGRGCEDMDFSWRAQLAGLVPRVAEGSVLYYRQRDAAGASFAAERGYNRAAVLLWVRFRDEPGITGMSLGWSLRSLLRALLSVRPTTLREPARRRDWARRVGADVGSVEGHLRYRLLGSPPDRELLAVDPERPTSA